MRTGALAAAFLAATALLLAPQACEAVREAATDRLMHFVPRPEMAPSPVVTVAVGEADLAALGPWPWPRGRFATLIARLTEAGAAAIALDIAFVEPAAEDAALAGALTRAPAVLGLLAGAAPLPKGFGLAILGTPNLQELLTLPGATPLAVGGAPAALAALPGDPVRSVPMLAHLGNGVAPGLAVAALARALGAETLARQLVLQARRWMPGRPLVLVADSSFAALELLASLVRQDVTCITRLRLDAALYAPAAPRQPRTRGRPRTKGERLPTLATVLANQATPWQRVTVPDWYGEGERVLEICSDTAVWRHSGLPVVPVRWVLLRDPSRRFDPQALLCTDLAQEPLQILRWFTQRWQLEVTFREARDHLGVETQRQWSDQAIARTTPCLLGLFSVVTLLANRLSHHARLRVSAAAWYRKQRPTFADSLAAVRRQIWREQGFLTSRREGKTRKLRPALHDGIVHALCYAA